MRHHAVVAVLLSIVAHGAWADGPSPPVRSPRLRAVDLDIGETVRVDLCDGTTAHVKLLALGEARDPIR